jgi:hypothetical protein
MDKKTKQIPSKFEWKFLRSLADKLDALETDPSLVLTKITIDAIDKPDPDGVHKRNMKVSVKYKKGKAPGDYTLDLEHRDDCPWN